MIFKGQCHKLKQMAPSDSLTSKNIDLDAKIVIVSALVQKLWSKTSFLHNGGQCNVRVRHTFILFKIFFRLLKSPDPSYSVLKFGDKVYSRNRDMAQNVILQGCDLERSRSSVKVNKFSIKSLSPTHKYTCEVSLKSYNQFFSYGLSIVDRKVARRKTKKKDRI